MKGIIMAMTSLCVMINAYGQEITKTGTSKVEVSIFNPIMKRTIKVEVGHSISAHWSAEAAVWKGFQAADNMSDEEKLHADLLGKDSPIISGRLDDKYRVCLSFWPSGTYRGMFLSVGCCKVGYERTDISIGTGYMMNIWKGLTLNISIESGLTQIKEETTHLRDHIDIGINYIF